MERRLQPRSLAMTGLVVVVAALLLPGGEGAVAACALPAASSAASSRAALVQQRRGIRGLQGLGVSTLRESEAAKEAQDAASRDLLEQRLSKAALAARRYRSYGIRLRRSLELMSKSSRQSGDELDDLITKFLTDQADGNARCPVELSKVRRQLGELHMQVQDIANLVNATSAQVQAIHADLRGKEDELADLEEWRRQHLAKCNRTDEEAANLWKALQDAVDKMKNTTTTTTTVVTTTMSTGTTTTTHDAPATTGTSITAEVSSASSATTTTATTGVTTAVVASTNTTTIEHDALANTATSTTTAASSVSSAAGTIATTRAIPVVTTSTNTTSTLHDALATTGASTTTTTMTTSISASVTTITTATSTDQTTTSMTTTTTAEDTTSTTTAPTTPTSSSSATTTTASTTSTSTTPAETSATTAASSATSTTTEATTSMAESTSTTSTAATAATTMAAVPNASLLEVSRHPQALAQLPEARGLVELQRELSELKSVLSGASSLGDLSGALKQALAPAASSLLQTGLVEGEEPDADEEWTKPRGGALGLAREARVSLSELLACEAGAVHSAVGLAGLVPPSWPHAGSASQRLLGRCSGDQRYRLEQTWARSFTALSRLFLRHGRLAFIGNTSAEPPSPCEESAEAEFSARKAQVDEDRSRLSSKESRRLVELDVLGSQLDNAKAAEVALTKQALDIEESCGRLSATTTHLGNMRTTIQALSDCPGLSHTTAVRLPRWSGQWLISERLDASAGMTDAQLDEEMQYICARTAGGNPESPRAAEVSEIAEQAIQGLPESNTAGVPVLGACPSCEGDDDSATGSHHASGHARVCWGPGSALNVPSRSSDCSSGRKAVVCVIDPA
mmetsp:Transcript_47084/g.103018  ORF Transcript_47084/g.103018 Transcript_47084/m.103018 type:complete len:857 (-) Transcript_47084:131-2701(-)